MTQASIRDADGRDIREGDAVHLLGLAPGLLDGLPEEDVAFLQAAIGMRGEVDEILGDDVSVMLKQSNSRYHFIRSPGRLLRILDAAATTTPSKA